MSRRGIEIFAEAMTAMQMARDRLLRIGTEKTALGTKSGNQDILLGQLLHSMIQDHRDTFCKITTMKIARDQGDRTGG